MEIYNVQPAIVDIRIIKGDTFNMIFAVQLNAEEYTLTAKQIDIKAKRFDGTVVKTLSSAGGAPAITITDATFWIQTNGFDVAETLKYDVQITDGTEIFTIQKGKIIVEEETT